MQTPTTDEIIRALDLYVQKHGTTKIHNYLTRKTQRFIPPILHTILMYVEPHLLTRFFIMHELDFNIKFSYDAFHYKLTIKEANTIFQNFSFIVIIGITIYDIYHNLCDLQIIKNNIKRMKLTGHTYYNDDANYSSPEFLQEDLYAIKDCTHITYLNINNADIWDLNCLNKCINLRVLKLTDCQYLHKIPNFENLRDMYIVNCGVTHIKIISLKHLSIKYCSNLKKIECKYLKYLHVYMGYVFLKNDLKFLKHDDIAIQHIAKIPNVYIDKYINNKELNVGQGKIELQKFIKMRL